MFSDQKYYLHMSKGFKSIGLPIQEKKGKTDFQDGGHGSHFGFPIRMILAIFLSTSHPAASYQVSSH